MLGAALWVRTDRRWWPIEKGTALLGSRAGPDAGRLSEVMETMDERHPKEPHAYLWFIGVVPDAQRGGIGDALMSHVLERIDRAGTPAYLEATSPGSKKLYEKHGFVAWTPFIVGDETAVWPMWREPRKA